MLGGHLWNDLEPIRAYLLDIYQAMTDRSVIRAGDLVWTLNLGRWDKAIYLCLVKTLKKHQKIIKTRWKRWRYKNTLLLVISLIAFYYLIQLPVTDQAIKQIGNLGYLGAFVAGIFFVSTFTVAPAGLVLYRLAENLHPVEVALLAGLGAMVGDYIIFRFMKDKVFEELAPLFRQLHTPKVRTLFKSPYFGWLMPLTGALIIASPVPDEVGVSMLGLSKIRPWQFFLVTFTLNALGIFLIVTAAKLI